MKSIYKYLISPFFLVVALGLIAGCSEDYKYNTDYSSYDHVNLKINLVDEKDVLSVKLANATHDLTVAVTPEDLFIDSRAYIYELSDPTIATISVDGMLTVLKVGETTLTVKFRGNKEISTSCTLRVEPTLVSDLIIKDEGIRVEEDKTIDLAGYVTVIPSSADNQLLRYSVKDGYEDMVEVVEGSIVRGLQKGLVVVMVSTTDGSDVSREFKLEVTGKIPVEEIKLNRAEKLNGGTFAIGQVFDLGSVLTVLPPNASDPTLAYEIVSGEGVVAIENGVVKTMQTGDVEIKISATDEFQHAASHTIKFKVDAGQLWYGRAFWFVDTTVDYGNGHNYVPENDGENGKPEKLIDGNNSTYLMMVKPEKGSYNGHKHPAGAEYGFIIDLGGEQEFNYFKWTHRTGSSSNFKNFQVFTVRMSGSNDNEKFTVIEEKLEIGPTPSEKVIEVEKEVTLSKYRYIKMEYTSYDPVNGSNTCVAGFNVCKK